MGYDAKRLKVHCFACGADYDLFDLLALDENLASPREALALASKRYGRGDTAASGGEAEGRGGARRGGEGNRRVGPCLATATGVAGPAS